MKVPKQLVRNPDGTKTLERQYKLAIHDGKAVRVYSTSAGYVLPRGARWATEDDAHHGEVSDGIAKRAAQADPRKRQ